MLNRKSLLAAGLLIALAVPAFAQTKIAVASPAKIFGDLQETKDIVAKMDADIAAFKTEVGVRQQKIVDMQRSRDDLKSDSPQYAEADTKLNDEKAAFDTWGKSQQANIQRRQKEMTRRLFDKIVTVVNEVAKEKGFDLVITKSDPEIPQNLENVPLNALQDMLIRRNVLFAKPELDLTAEVTTRLDAKYKEGK